VRVAHSFLVRRSFPTLELMKRCPHCRGRGIPWRKFVFSTPGGPSTCTLCGGLAYPNDALSMVLSLLTLPALVGAGYASLRLQSWWPLIGLFFFCFIVWPAVLVSLPAIRTSEVKARKARRNMAIGLVLFIAAVLLAGIFGNEF
jgi:hypothetical protein